MTFINSIEQSFHIQFDSQQRQAIQHTAGPALILAVPGAGKTTTLICRTGHLIFQNHIHPQSILSLTFSRAAATDMKDRFNEIFRSKVHANITFSTFHSFCYRILKAFDKTMPQWQLIEGKDAPVSKKRLVGQIYQSLNHELPNEEIVDEILRQIGVAKNRESKVPVSPLVKSLPEIASLYEAEKEKHRWFDYDDLILHTLKLFRENPSIRKQLQAQYPYIQIDETQDLSPVQFRLIECLLSPSNNLFMVADDDQSIYGFRGAMPEELFQFVSKIEGFSTYRMETNFRSGAPLIEAANLLIGKNESRFKKTMAPYMKNTTSLQMILCNDPVHQLKEVERSLAAAPNGETVGILFRNRISSIPLLDLCEKLALPVQTRDLQTNFFRSALFRDFKAFFLFALDPSDGTSFDQIWYKFNGYIRRKDYEAIRAYDAGENILIRLQRNADLPLYQKKNLKRVESAFHDIQRQRPSYAIETILRDLEYRDYLDRKKESPRYRGETDAQHLSILMTLASQSISIMDFLSRCETLEKRMYTPQRASASLTLSTLHGAKGLEFDHVFMVDLVDDILPSAIAKKQSAFGDRTLLEEERRLFYVGMTRAKKTCRFFSYRRLDQTPCQPSPYLAELQPFFEEMPSDSWSVGMMVRHVSLGKGRIVQIDAKFIWIEFAGKETKQFSRAFVARHDLLEKN